MINKSLPNKNKLSAVVLYLRTIFPLKHCRTITNIPKPSWRPPAKQIFGWFTVLYVTAALACNPTENHSPAPMTAPGTTAHSVALPTMPSPQHQLQIQQQVRPERAGFQPQVPQPQQGSTAALPVCVPGSIKYCICPGANNGTQRCSASGVLGPCGCPNGLSAIPKLDSTQTMPNPSAATPNLNIPDFSPLIGPVQQLYSNFRCGAEKQFAHLKTVSRATWVVPEGPQIILKSKERVFEDAEAAGRLTLQVKLLAKIPSQKNWQILMNQQLGQGQCIEYEPTIAQMGVRKDGLLLVSIDTLPWVHPLFPEEGTSEGHSYRALITYNNPRGSFKSVDVYTGVPSKIPAHLRFK